MKYFIALVVISLVSVMIAGSAFAQRPDDWLKDAFEKSHQPPGGSGDPYSADIEADDMFSTNLANTSTGLSDSVFVRIARWLMRVGVMLGIPLLLYVGIKVMLAFGDKSKLSKALKELGYVILGLLILLGSVMIVFLIASITRGSLDNFAF